MWGTGLDRNQPWELTCTRLFWGAGQGTADSLFHSWRKGSKLQRNDSEGSVTSFSSQLLNKRTLLSVKQLSCSQKHVSLEEVSVVLWLLGNTQSLKHYLGITNTIAHYKVSGHPPLCHLICTKSAEGMARPHQISLRRVAEKSTNSLKHDNWLFFLQNKGG